MFFQLNKQLRMSFQQLHLHIQLLQKAKKKKFQNQTTSYQQMSSIGDFFAFYRINVIEKSLRPSVKLFHLRIQCSRSKIKEHIYREKTLHLYSRLAHRYRKHFVKHTWKIQSMTIQIRHDQTAVRGPHATRKFIFAALGPFFSILQAKFFIKKS